MTLQRVEDRVAIEHFAAGAVDLEDDLVIGRDSLEVADELLGADAVITDLVEDGDFGLANFSAGR